MTGKINTERVITSYSIHYTKLYEDLLIQAKREFTARGLIVHIVDSKADFVKSIKTRNNFV